jgi:hypothetical protein
VVRCATVRCGFWKGIIASNNGNALAIFVENIILQFFFLFLFIYAGIYVRLSQLFVIKLILKGL